MATERSRNRGKTRMFTRAEVNLIVKKRLGKLQSRIEDRVADLEERMTGLEEDFDELELELGLSAKGQEEEN